MAEFGERKLPGGKLEPKPVVIEGVAYDPFDPPKLLRQPDGTTTWIGGTKLEATSTEPSTHDERLDSIRKGADILNAQRAATEGAAGLNAPKRPGH